MRTTKRTSKKQLLLELENQRLRLQEVEETLRAIHNGEVDALVISDLQGKQIFTLKDADYSYRLLVEGIDEGAVVLTNSGSIMYANRRFAAMVRMPLGDLIGSGIDAWVAPDSRDRFRSLLEKKGEKERRKEMMLIASDGTQVHVHLSASTHAVSEMPDYICLLVTDLSEINERKRREAVIQATSEYTRSLIEANRDPLMVIDTWLRITDVNVAMEQVIGLDRSQLIGSDSTACFTEPDLARAGFHEVFRHGSITDHPLSIRHLSGQVTDLLYNANLWHDNNGNILGALTTARDITKRKQVEAQDALERLNRDKDLFLANISHELRTPLLSILQFAVLAKRRWMEGRQTEAISMLNNLLSGKERLLRFVTNLEHMARIHVGLWSIHPVNGDLMPLVQATVRTMQQRFAEKNLQWHVTGPKTAMACFDEPTVSIILNELLDNGGLYSPPMGIVKLQVITSKDMVQIAVIDSGPGIPVGEEETIFSPFIESTLTRSNAGGTGLGLPIARGLARLHGGTILAINRQDGPGTEVMLVLSSIGNEAE